MRIGDRVRHAYANGHGLGEIVALNQQQPVAEHQIRPGEQEGHRLNMLAAYVTLSCAYSADRYPFIVRFDSGFQEVYGESELELV
jgi:hypothetical protein